MAKVGDPRFRRCGIDTDGDIVSEHGSLCDSDIADDFAICTADRCEHSAENHARLGSQLCTYPGDCRHDVEFFVSDRGIHRGVFDG